MVRKDGRGIKRSEKGGKTLMEIVVSGRAGGPSKHRLISQRIRILLVFLQRAETQEEQRHARR